MRTRLMRNLRRPLVIGVTLAVLIIAGGGTYWLTASTKSKTSSAPYRLIPATTGTIKQSVSSTGTIEPAQQDELNFAVSGKVTSVRVAEGAKVNAGDVLATVDSAELNAALAQAKAVLANNQAKLASDQDASASDTQLAADQATVTTAEDQVTSAQNALADATLTSPIKGVVATVNLDVGQQVSGSVGSGSSGSGGVRQGSGSGSAGGGGSGAGASGGGAGQSGSSSGSSSSTAQFLVISTDSWIVDATVDSSGVGLIAKGDQATIVPGTGSSSATAGLGLGGGRAGGAAAGLGLGSAGRGAGTTVFGTISSIGLIATNTSGTASYPVEVKVTGNPSGLHAGDSATVALIYHQLSNVLTVPTLAVSQVSGKSVVYQISGGKRVARTVTTGLASGGLTQIKSGLSEGDQVVVEIPQATGGSSGGSANRNGGGFGGGGFGGGGGGFGGGGFGGRRVRRCRWRRAQRQGRSYRTARPPFPVATDMGVDALDITMPIPAVGGAASPVIELTDVRKTYRTGAVEVEALRGVSMRIHHGEYVAIMGPSGSGKSTLMHIIGCLDVLSVGRYLLAGEDVSEMTEVELAEVRNRQVGFVFQQFNLLASLNAWRNVELPLTYGGVRRDERRRRAIEALARVGLADRVEHRPGELSGGQQQRVAVARALVGDPSLILADEPTGNLDSMASEATLDLFDELHRSGATIVLITHEAEIAERARRIVRIRDGLIQSDTGAL